MSKHIAAAFILLLIPHIANAKQMILITGTCRNFRLVPSSSKPHIMQADCENFAGEVRVANLDLDAVVENNDGTLKFKPGPERGNFSQICDKISLKGFHLTATCRRLDHGQAHPTTTLDLSREVFNDDGVLRGKD